MLNDLLREIIIFVAGKPAEELAILLNTNKHVNEFLIAKKLDLTINQTRNLLYKISDKGLLSSQKKKDKKKGWFTYFWKIDILKSLEFYKHLLISRRNELERQLNSRETKEFFECKTCGIEVTAENALLYDFSCNECGKIFTPKDNFKEIKNLKNEIDKLNSKLLEVESEAEKEMIKQQKSVSRQVAKEKKEKAEARKKRLLKKGKKKVAIKKPAKKKQIKKVVKKTAQKKKPVEKKNPKKTIKKSKTKKVTAKKLSKKSPKKKKISKRK
jgi:transcription factor E